MLNKQLKPPFIPELTDSVLDLSHFDEGLLLLLLFVFYDLCLILNFKIEFIDQPVSQSPVEPHEKVKTFYICIETFLFMF